MFSTPTIRIVFGLRRKPPSPFIIVDIYPCLESSEEAVTASSRLMTANISFIIYSSQFGAINIFYNLEQI